VNQKERKRLSCIKWRANHPAYQRERYQKDPTLREKERIRKGKWYASNPFRYWSRNSISHHKRSGFVVKLSINWLEKLAEESIKCRICGNQLDWKIYGKNKVNPKSPTLDRLNNEKELREDNVIIICHECNRTKGARSWNEFISYCRMVASTCKPIITAVAL